MIVVDTTVWIDFFAARGSDPDRELTRLVEASAPVALTDLVYCEILQGIREESSFRRTRTLLRRFPILRPAGLETFDRAASLYRECRKRGFTVRKLVDCVIAAVCLESNAALLHHDRDFDAIAKVVPLRIHPHPA